MLSDFVSDFEGTLSGIFDELADALSLQFLASFFAPVTGLFMGPYIYIWCSTNWTCRKVRKLMEKNGIYGWGYTEVIEPENRFVMFQVVKTDEERCNELIEQEIPRYMIG